jgi:hypothetical protein
MSEPTWKRQPRSAAAVRNAVISLFITTSPTKAVDAIRATSIGIGSPSFIPRASR